MAFNARCTLVQSAVLGLHVIRPSVRNVGGSGPHRLEILETNCTTISLTPSLSVAQRPYTYYQGNIGEFGEPRGGVGKSDVLEHKSGNISETRKDRGKVTMDGQCSFERYHPQPRSASPSPRLGVRNPHQKLQSLLSQERVKLRTSNLASTFRGPI